MSVKRVLMLTMTFSCLISAAIMAPAIVSLVTDIPAPADSPDMIGIYGQWTFPLDEFQLIRDTGRNKYRLLWQSLEQLTQRHYNSSNRIGFARRGSKPFS